MIYSSFIKEIQETILQYAMFQEKDRVLVAVSGGADSIALLYVLHHLVPSLDLKLFVAHVNHLLRGEESNQDAVFVRNIAFELGLEFCLTEVDVRARATEKKKSTQEAARDLRYEAFIDLRKRHQVSKIALAHTADDQAETVLMRILYGTGPEGMGGIPPVREGLFVRPLIKMPRTTIEAFLKREKIPFRHDSSNDSRKYLRNRIRLDLLPVLKKDYNPNLSSRLSEVSDIFREESALIEKIIDNVWSDILQDETPEALHLDLRILRTKEISLQRRIIRRAYQIIKGDRKGLSFKQIQSILNLSGEREKVYNLTAGLQVRKSGNTLSIGKLTNIEVPETRICIPGITSAGCCQVHTCLLKNMPLPFPSHNLEAYFDWDNLVPPLVLRTRQPGDFMIPLGMKGRKKIHDILTDAKIPRHQRLSVPILCDGKGILWVYGLRRCGRATVKPHTKNILQVKIDKDEI